MSTYSLHWTGGCLAFGGTAVTCSFRMWRWCMSGTNITVTVLAIEIDVIFTPSIRCSQQYRKGLLTQICQTDTTDSESIQDEKKP